VKATLNGIGLITRAGTPTATIPAGISLVTTEPAPITQLAPILTPGHTITIHHSYRAAHE
jgi:hypothetical protein